MVFLVYENGKFLLEERTRQDSAHLGYFTVPGGNIEPGETPQDALLRELTEEQGIKPLSFELLDSFENMSLGGKHHLLHAFLISDFEGEVVNREPEKCKLHWVSADKAKSLLRLASSRLILFKALETLAKDRSR